MATNPSQGLPVVRIENTSAAQANVPFTFGQVFKVGALKPGAGLSAQIDGATVPLQVDYKATHADGSVRHAIVSGILPKLAAGATVALQLTEAKAVASKALSPAAMPDGAVEITIDGVKYSTNGSKFGDVIEWLSGPLVREGFVSADLLGTDGKPHPQLTVRAGIRAYSVGLTRIEIIVENAKTWVSARNFTYDVALQLKGKVVFEQKDLTHYLHARWRKVFWSGQEPSLHVKHDPVYLMATKAVSNYDPQVKFGASYLRDVANSTNESNTGPMKIGPVVAYMPTAGGRGDIGSLPSFAVAYLLSGDIGAGKSMMAIAEGSGAWSIHYRDEKTGYPVRTDNEANKGITLHNNMADWGPLPVPRNVVGAPAGAIYEPDTAHQPSIAYLPYLLTGEYYYLEELQFWACWNPLGTAPGNHGDGKGLVRWQQLRAQAWSLRTLGHAAYITPDSHPLKTYFNKQVDNNLDFYHQAYVVGNPNKLGVYDGSGQYAFEVNGSAPWQDDFLTWSFGYLAELGFSKAEPILKWKAKYVVGRMTAPGYCWIQGTPYWLKFRDDVSKPIYDSFAKLYKANFDGVAFSNDDGEQFIHPEGVKFIDLPCGSKAQADFMTMANGYEWTVGQMTGYSGGDLGYTSNMQPALALAVDSGIENAEKAWGVYEKRGVRPTYETAPQWNILPRAKEQPQVVEVPPVVPPPVVLPQPSKNLTITTPANKVLSKMKSLTVQVDDLNAMKLEQTFIGVNATTDGSVSISGPTFTKSKKYQVTIRSENNMLVGVFYPMIAV